MKNKALFNLDWLEFSWTFNSVSRAGLTFQAGLSIWENFKLVFPEFQKYIEESFLADYKLAGYDMVLCCSDYFKFCYSSKESGMGVHVVIPSHSLWMLGEAFQLDYVNDEYQCAKLFRILLDRGVKFTRIDICYDDYNKHITPFEWNMMSNLGQVECKARSRSYIASCFKKGDTMYFGKRSGGRMLRIYDKEYESDGEVDAIRYEFEFKRNYSESIAEHIANGCLMSFRKLIEDFICVYGELKHQPEEISRTQLMRDRAVANILDEWLNLLEDVESEHYSQNAESVSILSNRKEPTFYARLEWFRQISKALCCVFECIGEREFLEIINSARENLSELDKSIIKEHLNCKYKF